MNGYQVFLLLLVGYSALLVATGCYFNKRQTSLREFLLGGRRAGPFSIAFSAAASWLTAGAVLAVIVFFMLLAENGDYPFAAVLPKNKSVLEVAKGTMAYFQVSVDLPVHHAWRDYMRLLSVTHPYWLSLSGVDSMQPQGV